MLACVYMDGSSTINYILTFVYVVCIFASLHVVCVCKQEPASVYMLYVYVHKNPYVYMLYVCIQCVYSIYKYLRFHFFKKNLTHVGKYYWVRMSETG